jgi:hypothetical protein
VNAAQSYNTIRLPANHQFAANDRPSKVSLWVGLLTLVVAIEAISATVDYLRLFYGAALVLAIMYAAVRGPRSLLLSWRAARPLYVLTVIISASYFWSIDPETTLQHTLHFLSCGAVFYVAHDMALRGNRAWVRNLAVTQAAVICCLFLYLLTEYGTVRAVGNDSPLNSFSNEGAAQLVICLAYIVHGYITRRHARMFHLLAGAITTMGVIISESRGAYLGVGFLAVGAVLFSKGNKRRLLNAMLISAALAATLAIATAGSETQSMISYVTGRIQDSKLLSFATSGGRAGKDDTLRVEMYGLGTSIFLKHPYLGVGYYAFGSLFQEQTGKYEISHSLAVTAFAELGLLGAAVIIWLIVASIRLSYLAVRRAASRVDSSFSRATLLALSVALIEAQFRPQFDNPLFFIVLALAFSQPSQVVRVTSRSRLRGYEGAQLGLGQRQVLATVLRKPAGSE